MQDGIGLLRKKRHAVVRVSRKTRPRQPIGRHVNAIAHLRDNLAASTFTQPAPARTCRVWKDPLPCYTGIGADLETSWPFMAYDDCTLVTENDEALRNWVVNEGLCGGVAYPISHIEAQQTWAVEYADEHSYAVEDG